MENRIFWNILVATDASELAKKAVGSAIKSAKLNNTKLYAVNVISPGEISVTQRDPRDIEWKKQVKELLEAQGREATAYAKTAGKIVNVTVEPVILEGPPADEIVNFAEKMRLTLLLWVHLEKLKSRDSCLEV